MQTGQLQEWAPHTVNARNYIADSANKIHSDAEAKKLGFSGALIGGVYVYGYMVHSLAARFGEEWLNDAAVTVRFFKPAYDGDRLTMETQSADNEPGGGERAATVIAYNPEGTELARLDTHRPLPHPDLRPTTDRAPAETQGGPIPITWEAVVPDRPLRAMQWHPSVEDNARWCDQCDDHLELFRSGDRPPLHPGFVLRSANRVFSEHFLMNPWIHVSSNIIHHKVLRAGQSIEVRAVPTRKWRKKGHEMAEYHVALMADGACAQEIVHEVIFKIRPR